MILFRSLGFIFVGIAALGMFVPLLPTTPFVLLAAGCFAKSSDKWHQWLLSSKTFGPIIKNWRENRCISYSTKIVAISSIILFGGYSIFFAVDNLYLKLLGLFLFAWGFSYVCRLKTCGKE